MKKLILPIAMVAAIVVAIACAAHAAGLLTLPEHPETLFANPSSGSLQIISAIRMMISMLTNAIRLAILPWLRHGRTQAGENKTPAIELGLVRLLTCLEWPSTMTARLWQSVLNYVRRQFNDAPMEAAPAAC